MKIYFIFPLLLSLFITNSVNAETDLNILKGLSKYEIISIFGEPDETRSSKVRSDASLSETLIYGRSQILLLDNSVVSWSDTGELKNLLKTNSNEINKNSWEEWPNPWTAPHSASFRFELLAIE